MSEKSGSSSSSAGCGCGMFSAGGVVAFIISWKLAFILVGAAGRSLRMGLCILCGNSLPRTD
jgi:hypothetical protein